MKLVDILQNGMETLILHCRCLSIEMYKFEYIKLETIR